MPDEFGIIGTAIQQIEEMNDDLFSDVAIVRDEPPVKKPTPKKKEEEEEKEKEKATPELSQEEMNDSLFEEETKEEPAVEKKEEEKKAEDAEFNQFEALSKNLYELGIFSAELDEEGNPVYELGTTPEQFKELWEDQKAKALDTSLYNYLMNKHGEEGVNVFKAIFQDGISPKEYFQTYTELQDLDLLDIENESHQEQIVKESLRQAGWKDDKISARISKLKDRAELQEEAEMLLPQMIEQKQQALLDKQDKIKKAEERKQAEEIQIKTSVSKLLTDAVTLKELDGLAISPEKARKLSEYYINKPYKNQNTGERYSQFEVDLMELKKPENIKTSLKLAALMFDKLDLSSVQKKAISKESGSLFKEFVVKKEKKSPASTGGSSWNI